MSTTEPVDTLETTGAYPKYDEYEDSGTDWLGRIPRSWSATKLKFVSNIEMGNSPESKHYNKEGQGPPFLQGNAEFDHKHPEPDRFCSDPDKIASTGDLLLSVRAPVGEINVADRQYGIGRGLCAITPDSGSLDEEYAYYNLIAVRDQLQLLSTGSTYDSVSHKDVAGMRVVVPPFPEQRAIATFLDRETGRIDALIEKKEELIDLLEEKRTALISRVVTKGLDPDVEMQDSGVEWLGEIPAHWDSVQLKRLWDVVDCKHRTAEYVDNGIPILSTTEVKPGRVDLNGARQTTVEEFKDLAEGKREPKQGDIIYSRNASIGSAAYVDTQETFCMGQDVCLIRSEEQNQLYLSYQLNSPIIHHQLEVEAVGATFQRINVSQINRLEVAVPPLSEQNEIAGYLDDKTAKIDAFIERVKDGVSQLRKYRTAIISAAVTGQIDIREEVAMAPAE